MLERQIWVETKKDQRGWELGGGGGGGLERKRIREIISTATFTQILNYEPTKKRYDINKTTQ